MQNYNQQRINTRTPVRVIEEVGRQRQSYVATVGRVIETAKLTPMPSTIELALQSALQKLSRQGGDNVTYFAKLES